MLNKSRDVIRVVEASYEVNHTVEDWVGVMIDAIDPILNRGHGVIANLWRLTPVDFEMEHFQVSGTRQEIAAGMPELPGLTSREMYDVMLRYGSKATTLSEMIFGAYPKFAADFLRNNAGHFPDAMGVVCAANAERVFVLSTPLESATQVGRHDRQRLDRVAAHIASGLRLRSNLVSLDIDNGGATEAIFKPGGQLLDARGDARSKSARERLRRAVDAAERARGPLRRDDPGQALVLWEALIAGRWSLVDHFDSDGSRLIVALKNPPSVRDPRGLTLLELSIAEAVGRGRSTKQIAYAFGVSVAAVNNAIANIKVKLGIRSRAELVEFFSPGGVRARLSTFEIGTDSMLVARYHAALDDGIAALAGLSEAEVAVAVHLLQGATNARIAQQRGTSPNTVANQIKAVFAKTGVTSRSELAALMSA